MILTVTFATAATFAAPTSSSPTISTPPNATAPSSLTDSLADAWRWSHYDRNAGLPSDRVFNLIEARDGTMWAVTSLGLAWFDDYRWQPFATELDVAWRDLALHPAPSEGVMSTCEGKISFATRRGFDLVEVTDAEGSPLAISSAAPLESDILVATDRGLFRYTNDRVIELPEPDGYRRDDPVQATPNGVPWIVTDTGTHAWNDGGWKRVSEQSLDALHIGDSYGLAAVFDRSNPGLWTWSGPPGSPLRAESLGNSDVTAIHAFDGEAAILYRDGRVRVGRPGAWTEPADLPLPSADLATIIRVARSGELWVGGNQGVAFCRRTQRWSHWRTSSPLTNVINSLLIADDGQLWCGTDDGLVVHTTNGRVRTIASVDDRRLGIVTALHQDSEGGIWIGSGSSFTGVFRYRDGVWQHFGPEQGFGGQHVHAITGDRRGRTWFLGLAVPINPATEPGAWVLEDGKFEHWNTTTGLPDNRVYAVAEGLRGELWFGTVTGLSRWRAGEWTYWKSDRGIHDARVFAVHCDLAGRTWFGHNSAEHGLGYVDSNDQVHYLTTQDGLPHDDVRALVTDKLQRLWISTAAGIARLHQGQFIKFDRRTGLDHPETWPIVPADERVFVGTMGGGLAILHLDEANLPPPRVTIDPPRVTGELTQLRWRADAYRGSQPFDVIETRYRLHDGEWSNWGTTRELEIYDHNCEHHRLEVQAKGLFGAVDPGGAVLAFHDPLDPAPTWVKPAAVTLGLLVVLATVVAGLKRAEHHRRLRASEERNRRLVEAVPICIHEIDLAGRMLSMNPAGLAMINASDEREVIGADYFRFVAAEDRARLWELFELAKSGQTERFEFTALVGDDCRRFESSFVPIRNDRGAVHKIMGYTQDLTERYRSNEQRDQLQSQLHAAQKMEAIGLLAGGVAHDFNNLLTVIVSHSSTIANDREARPALVAGASEILAASERAADLTRQLLAFGRRQMLKPRVIDLATVLADVERMLRRIIGEQIELTVDCESGCHVVADLSQISQVLMNLVVNARDAMPGGGSLRIECRSRELDTVTTVGSTTIEPGRYVVVTVNDDGIGMTPEVRSRVFEPFFTTKAGTGGSGLGLSTAYGIVEQSGGHLTVTSERGVGTQFSLFLPRTNEPVSNPGNPNSEAPHAEGHESILVVEDDEAIRNLVDRILSKVGYHVVTATDGIDALPHVRSTEESIDMLITDIVMPRMGGRELAETFRELHPERPMMFMTGYAGDVELEEFADETVLAKPFGPDALVATVRKVLDDAVTRSSAT